MSKTFCKRCGQPARGSTGSPDARILRRAETGVCVECGVVEFLQRLDNMNSGHLLPEGKTWAEALHLPHVQSQFAAVLKAGHSDATPEDIDWERVIAVWDLAPRATGVLF